MQTREFIPRLVVLELTRKCTLNCIHCRASSNIGVVNNELTTNEWFDILDDIASIAKPIIILSGGEALLRKDIFQIISYACKKELTVVLATCGEPLTEDKAKKLKEAGIKRVSVSIDGKDAKTHDFMRGSSGSFESALRAIELLKKYEIEFQINTTVTQYNFRQLDEIFDLAINLGAMSFHPFFLVPVGRASQIQDEQLSDFQYEQVLNRLYKKAFNSPISFRPTCAPHYFRILLNANQNRFLQDNLPQAVSLDAKTIGCLGGKYFAFISSTGKVQACGFLEVECGDTKINSFSEIWRKSIVFNQLRDFNLYKGRCGECQYLIACGGCRARAYEINGGYLDEEPECTYQPMTVKS